MVLGRPLHIKEQFGDANVSGYNKSFDEYALYLWQEEQRIKFKEWILDASEISRLEKIGFKWK
jgi:hypothetical protein